MTALDLLAMDEGSAVMDATGDEWVKKGGLWICRDATMSGESLITVWGPLA